MTTKIDPSADNEEKISLKEKYYKDWHLDMREDKKNSFGLGIFPQGNTKVKVLIEDFGACVNRKDGKCRVWGFEIVD